MLVIEIEGQRVGELGPGDRPGSMSHNTPQGREIISFSCHGDHSLIERSVGGADAEVGPLRTISSLGFEEIARLGPGEKVELWLRTDRMRRPMRVRFLHAP